MHETGGPAFPPDSIYSEANPGLTIRDWFATAALIGQRMVDRPISSEDVATVAYQDADAMLKEREKS